MAQLADDKLFSGTLPGEWHPLLVLLQELDALASLPKEGQETLEARRERARSLRARMVAQARRLEEDIPQTLLAASPEFRRWFTEAALLWCHFADAGGTVRVDTIPTVTLADYPLDFPRTEAGRADLRSALVRVFGWTDDELAAIEAKVRRLTTNLRLKTCLTRELARAFESPEERKQRALDLMCEVHGRRPFRLGDVDVVISATAVFLCLPYEGNALRSPDYAGRPADERAAIAEFLGKVHAEQQTLKSVRFPAFGIFDAGVVAPALLARLTTGARREPEFAHVGEATVAEAFSTMVTVLPTHEVEKFLVHDVWGHGWQQTLCEFEWKFRLLSAIGEPLGLPAGSRFVASGPALAEAFETRNGRTVVRPEVLLRLVEADLRERIAVGMNLVVSEFLADLIEHKFSRKGSPLPSSSLMPDSPLRLDLSLSDTRLMVRAWRRPYRRLFTDASERERIRRELVEYGVEDHGLIDAVQEAAVLVEERFRLALDDQVAAKLAGSACVDVNVLERIMLGVMTFDAALDQMLVEGDARWRAMTADGGPHDRWRCPPACIDFLALLVAWFYEQERALYVWHLDELVASQLGPTLCRLQEELRRKS
jgi:hypothetical protein